MIEEYFVNLPIKFIKGVINFFYFWYVQSSRDFWNREIAFVKQIERDLGIMINLRLITQPIFGDYSYMGRIIGPIFRLGRILIGLLIIAVSFVVIIFVYLIWIILPLLVFLMIILNLLYVFRN
jgi:hypothetical protein